MTKGATGDVKRVLLGREERRAQLIRAASRAFLRSGYAATSLDDIAHEADVTKVLIYRHFSAKRELYLAVLHDARGRVKDGIDAARRQDDDVVEALVRAGQADPDGFRILYRHVRREPEFATEVRDLDAADHAATEELLSDQITDEARRAWLSRLLPTVVIQSILAWLDTGQPIGPKELVRSIRAMTAAAVGRRGSRARRPTS